MSIVRFIIYIAVLIGSALPALYINNIYAYLPPIFVLMLGVISLIYAFFLRHFLKFSYVKRGHYVRGVPSEIAVETENRGILFFPRVSAVFSVRGEDGAEKLVKNDISLSPREKKRMIFKHTFEHIGEYAAGLKSVKIYGPLGILRFSGRSETVNAAKVGPHLVEIDLRINLSADNEGIKLTNERRTDDIVNYSGVRDYVPGDPLKRIHWKLSARLGQYMTRLYEDVTDDNLCVLIDLAEPHCKEDRIPFVYDCLIESALSIAAGGLTRDWRTEIVYKRNGYLQSTHPYSREEIEDFDVGEAKFGDENSIADEIAVKWGGRANRASIIVCTASLNSDLIYNLACLKNYHQSPILIYAAPGDESEPEMINDIVDQGIEVHVVKNADETKTMLECKR